MLLLPVFTPRTSSLSAFSLTKPPSKSIYRVGYPPNPFEPSPWEVARKNPDGTFGGRFDDPSANWETPLPEEERFRMVYCSTRPVAAFGECCEQFCPKPDEIGGLRRIPDEEPFDTEMLEGVIKADWRRRHIIGSVELDRSLHFVDLEGSKTLRTLRSSKYIARIAAEQNMSLDIGALIGSNRRFTQEVARFVYEHVSRTGTPLFAGIRYVSRLHRRWECWAIYSDRIQFARDATVSVKRIAADNLDMHGAARHLRLEIEVDVGRVISPRRRWL